MNARQQDLFTDLQRGQQLALLRSVSFESFTVGKAKVSGSAQKAVLRAIDDRAGNRECFASQATLAADTGLSVPTVKRVVAALVAQDLVTCERPNRMSANRHRIVWTSLALVAADSTDHSDPSRHHCDTPTDHHDTSRGITMIPQTDHGDPLNAPLNAKPTDHLPDDWAAVAADLREWGLTSATKAVEAALRSGWSIDYVRALFAESGGEREPQRWEPGQLANWLTGKTPPPFDEDEVTRRDERKWQTDAAKAEKIRQSVRADGDRRNVPPWVSAGLTCRKLQTADLTVHATATEIEAAKQLDHIDAKRSKPPEKTEQLEPIPRSRVRRAPQVHRSSRQLESRRLKIQLGLRGIGPENNLKRG